MAEEEQFPDVISSSLAKRLKDCPEDAELRISVTYVMYNPEMDKMFGEREYDHVEHLYS